MSRGWRIEGQHVEVGGEVFHGPSMVLHASRLFGAMEKLHEHDT